MFKKNTVIKAAVAVFCAGVLLGGIGTGVAIAEYTSLEYTGEHILGEENMVTENLDVTVTPEEGRKIRIMRFYHVNGVHYDEEIPMDTIRYVVTYNPDYVNFWTDYETYEEKLEKEADMTDGEDTGTAARESGKYQGDVWLESYYSGNEFDLFMRSKDKILGELKQGQVGSYRMESVKSIEIWMNPGMREFVEFS